MVSIFYVLMLQSIVCGLMFNRTLYSKTRYMWHFPLYVIVQSVICTYMTHLRFHNYVVAICTLLSLIYTLVFFGDKLYRKLLAVGCALLCLFASNGVKFPLLRGLDLTQNFDTTRDVLLTIIVLCICFLLFTFFTIVCTNLLCSVRLVIIGGITAVNLLILIVIALVYHYMHSLIPLHFNDQYTVFALFFLLPASGSLYFSESLTFSRKDNYFRESADEKA